MSWIGQLKSSRSNYCALALLALSVFAGSTIEASIVVHWKLKPGDRTEMAMLTGRDRQADSNPRSLNYVRARTSNTTQEVFPGGKTRWDSLALYLHSFVSALKSMERVKGIEP